MMTIFVPEPLVLKFFEETTLPTWLRFRGGERKAAETISTRKRQRS